MKTFTETDVDLAEDIVKGLTSTTKYISSKYFYDEQGSKIFQEIMNLPAYYITRAESSVFRLQGNNIIQLFGNEFDLIELGAGDGIKTEILIEKMLHDQLMFNYLPVDISLDVLIDLKLSFEKKYPELKLYQKHGDYFSMLGELNLLGRRRKIVLFLGSNLGNYNFKQSVEFLSEIAKNMNKNDMLVMGLDLKKDPEIILNAYNDNEGVTARFNMNLLHRLNKELGADFNVENFKHVPFYNPITGAACSTIVSTRNQVVFLKKYNIHVRLNAWEAIHTEISQKYDMKMIQELCDASGFEIKQNYYDPEFLFVNTCWVKK